MLFRSRRDRSRGRGGVWRWRGAPVEDKHFVFQPAPETLHLTAGTGAEAGGVFGGGGAPPLKTRVRVDIREEAHLLPRELDPDEVSLSFLLSFFLLLVLLCYSRA